MAVVKGSLGLLAAVALSGIIATSANAQDKSGYPYSIMREEGGAKPRTPEFGWEKEQPREPAKKPAGKRRIGSSSPSPVPPYQSTVTPLGTAPRIVETPPLGRAGAPGTVVPGVQTPTGPVMTPPRPAGQGFQDRARDCFHAGTAAGVPPGQIGAYTRACVNQ